MGGYIVWTVRRVGIFAVVVGSVRCRRRAEDWAGRGHELSTGFKLRTHRTAKRRLLMRVATREKGKHVFRNGREARRVMQF